MDYFGADAEDERATKQSRPNMKVHFTFDKNSLAQFFLMTKDTFQTQKLTNNQVQDQTELVDALQEKVITGGNSIKLETLAE